PRAARRRMKNGQVDLRLALPAVSAWLVAAVLQPASSSSIWTVAVVATACLGLSLLAARLTLAAVALGVAAGAATTAVHVSSLQRGAVAQLARDKTTADVALRLVRDPVEVRASTGRRLVVVDATATAVRSSHGGWVSDHAPVVVFAVAGHWLGLLPGQRVVVSARLAPPRPGDTVAAVVLAAQEPKPQGRPPPWQRWAGRVRDAFRQACSGLPEDERGLVPGLVLGDVSAMPPALTQAFRVTGLAHLNAVSGANVAIVLGAVTGGVRRLGVGRRLTTILAALALAAFVVLVRPSPSVLRAAVMGAVVLVASMLGRRSSPVPVLAAAVLGLVLVDPFLARSPGFAMSVLATGAIVLVAPGWTERLSGSMPRPLAAAVAVPAAAQLACTPVIVAVFGQLTPLAIPANLLAAPAVAPATLAGIVAALLAVVLPSAAAVAAWVASIPAGWLAVVARTFAAVPGAGMRWPEGVGGVLLLAVTAAGVGVAGRLVRRRQAARPVERVGC
ncbi:MAG: competence protein ComEC, partial [Frankiaceae bacterium]|nr:competence protein ComEC [Frankiaceae bacterium]